MAYSAIGLQSPIGLQDTRNELINGEFNLWQRGITSSVGFAGAGAIQNTYCADRWRYYAQTSSTGKGSTAPDAQISRVNFGLDEPSGSVNSSKYYLNIFFGHTADLAGSPFIAPSAGEPHGGFSGGTGDKNFIALIQDIEDVNTLAGKSAILSFWAKSDFTNQVIVPRLKQFFAKDASSGSDPVLYYGTTGGRLTIDNTWRQYKTEFSISGINGKVLGTSGDHSLQLALYFHRCQGFGIGAGLAGTTMELGNGTGLTGNISIAQVQLEQGTNATEFDKKHPSVEIAQCQRYYEKSYDLDVAPGTVDNAAGNRKIISTNAKGYLTDDIATSNGLATIMSPFATRKRAVPTCHYYNPFSGTKDQYAANYTSDVETVSEYHAGENCISRVRFSTNGQYGVKVHMWHFTAEAELSVTTDS